jgi:hypothetical protein
MMVNPELLMSSEVTVAQRLEGAAIMIFRVDVTSY